VQCSNGGSPKIWDSFASSGVAYQAFLINSTAQRWPLDSQLRPRSWGRQCVIECRGDWRGGFPFLGKVRRGGLWRASLLHVLFVVGDRLQHLGHDAAWPNGVHPDVVGGQTHRHAPVRSHSLQASISWLLLQSACAAVVREHWKRMEIGAFRRASCKFVTCLEGASTCVYNMCREGETESLADSDHGGQSGLPGAYKAISLNFRGHMWIQRCWVGGGGQPHCQKPQSKLQYGCNEQGEQPPGIRRSGVCVRVCVWEGGGGEKDLVRLFRPPLEAL